MLAEIPNRLYVEWQRYWELEPFGALRDNIHAGIVAATIWQSALNPNDRSKVKPSDFLLIEGEEPRTKQSPDDIFLTLKAGLVRRR